MVDNNKELCNYINKVIKEGIQTNSDGSFNLKLENKDIDNLLKGFRVEVPSPDNKDYNYLLKYNIKDNTIDVKTRKNFIAILKDLLLPKIFDFEFKCKIELFDFKNQTLKDIPYPLRTKKVCEKAILENAGNYIYIPENLKSKFLDKAIQNDKNFLSYLPEKERSPEICQKCIYEHNHVDQLFHIPHEKELLEGIKNFIHQNGNVEANLFELIEKINHSPRHTPLLMKLTELEPFSIKHLNPKLLDEKIYLNAYKNDSSVWKILPPSIQNLDVLQIARKIETKYKVGLDENFIQRLKNGERILQFLPNGRGFALFEYNRQSKELTTKTTAELGFKNRENNNIRIKH